ncbi:hypothetical protein [Psychrobacter aquaticus]|uniref:Uncharacterized protein n=1 Tax=Psychrobacter aquaticus CMS 56 TaxID=1354303 RepID=U4TCD7_9GAMM|nr:hypothetical protein [Psychrobacter aquaticus]ERL56414.1 hypothetical protein M917_0692 [Psychrobacter aquaticus CMS 56]
MTHLNQNSQQPPENQLSKTQSWQRFLLKTMLGVLLPYLLSPPDISIYIYHITIALPHNDSVRTALTDTYHN